MRKILENLGIDKTKDIFWNENKVKVLWETLNLGGEVKIMLDNKKLSIDISELKNK